MRLFVMHVCGLRRINYLTQYLAITHLVERTIMLVLLMILISSLGFIYFTASLKFLNTFKVPATLEGEYEKLHPFFWSIGINHLVTCPHAHQQNGAAERKHRHIV
jgi:hypothetical protein